MIITYLILQHHEEQRRAAEQRQKLAAFPYQLSQLGHDVGVFTHLSARFTHAIPGRPQVTPPLMAHGEPATDAIVWMYDVPVSVRYRCEGQAVPGATAADVAVETAKRFANWRTQRETEVRPLGADWTMTFRADGAAYSRYDLPAPDATGANREELILMVRAGMTMNVTVRYPKGSLDMVTLASMRSFLWATALWEPAGMQQSPWPQSAFLDARVAATLVPGRHEQSAHLAQRLRVPPEQQEQLQPALLAMIEGKGRPTLPPQEDPFDVPAPPWAPVTNEQLNAHHQALTTTFPHPELKLFLEGTFPHVRTAHDLRGVALMLGRAIKTPA